MATHRILVPLDGSALAEMVMPTAIELGTALQADWILVQVIAPDPGAWALVTESWGPVGPWDPMVPAQDEQRDGAQTYLNAVRKQMGDRVGRVTVDVRQGPVLASLLAAVRNHAATLIAMSTHGRGGFNRMVMGSVTDMVIRLAPVPVVVVHPSARR